MSQPRAIDSGYPGSLRILPLPGRTGDAEPGVLRPQRIATDNDIPLSTADAARGVAGQSRQTDFAFAIGRPDDKAAAETIAQILQTEAKPYATRGGIGLSDEVVGFLLSANEVVEGQAVQTAEPPGSAALRTYQDASASFPRVQDSLFSLAA